MLKTCQVSSVFMHLIKVHNDRARRASLGSEFLLEAGWRATLLKSGASIYGKQWRWTWVCIRFPEKTSLPVAVANSSLPTQQVFCVDQCLAWVLLFLPDPAEAIEFPMDYLKRVKRVHSQGGYGSQGWDWLISTFWASIGSGSSESRKSISTLADLEKMCDGGRMTCGSNMCRSPSG